VSGRKNGRARESGANGSSAAHEKFRIKGLKVEWWGVGQIFTRTKPSRFCLLGLPAVVWAMWGVGPKAHPGAHFVAGDSVDSGLDPHRWYARGVKTRQREEKTGRGKLALRAAGLDGWKAAADLSLAGTRRQSSRPEDRRRPLEGTWLPLRYLAGPGTIGRRLSRTGFSRVFFRESALIGVEVSGALFVQVRWRPIRAGAAGGLADGGTRLAIDDRKGRRRANASKHKGAIELWAGMQDADAEKKLAREIARDTGAAS